MKKSLLFTFALFSTTSMLSNANTVHSIHVSEAGISEKDSHSESKNVGKSENQNIQQSHRTYLSKESDYKLDPQNNEDVQKLANSIEFEIYEIGENQTSHTIFESGAGICRGFNSTYGVDITDSRTYYVNKPSNEYYGSISGATVYSQ
ncbi:MAG: hypothetical protein MSQ14_06870, partial [[Pasteurella] aerogenes]|nr:hypothetical protein [[Pasteurella] aerogenes]